MENAIQSKADDRTGATVKTVCLWLKSFISADIEGAVVVPDGVHAGKTMLRSPGPVEAWFLTDQRGFSADKEAQARMHSEITLDLINFAVVSEFHKCGPTIQVDHKTGAVDCEETAGNDDMRFSDITFSQDAKRIALHLHGSSKNACLKVGPVKISPSLDYEADIVVFLSDAGREVTVEFDGMIETYPAFEMYVSVNDGTPVTVFQAPVEPGANPLSLTGPGTRPRQTSVTLSA